MSSFTYFPSIPAANDIIADSQPQIQTNFGSIGSWTIQDHFGFGTGNDGWHQQVTFPKLQAAPASQAGTSSLLYTNTVGVGTTPQLIFKNSNGNAQIAASGQTYTCTVTGTTASNPTFTMNFFVGGGITFFFGTWSPTGVSSSGFATISLPSTTLFGGIVNTYTSQNGVRPAPISASSSTVATVVSISSATSFVIFSGYYL